MEHARKLVLVEPRMLEELQAHMEYKNLLKAPHSRRKADLSLELHNVLNESETADDIKAKLYQQTFRRFRNMNNSMRKIDKSVVNPVTAPLARRHRRGQQQQPPTPDSTRQRTPSQRSSRKRRKTQQWSPF